MQVLPEQRVGGAAVTVRVAPPRATWRRGYRRAVRLSDAAAAMVAAAFAMSLSAADPTTALWSAGVQVAGFVVAAQLSRAYDVRYLGLGVDEYRAVLHATVGLAAFSAFLAYATRTDVPRMFVLVAVPMSGALALLGRWSVRQVVHRSRRTGRCIDRMLVVGHAAQVRDLVAQLRREPYCGLQVAGVCVPYGSADEFDVPTYWGLERAGTAAAAVGADSVAVTAGPDLDGPFLRRLSWQLQDSGIGLLVAPSLMEVAGPRLHIRPIGVLPLVHVEHPRLEGLGRVMKAAFDRLAAAVLLLLLLPVLVVIGLLVKLTSPGPVLFRQDRVGKDGETFTFLKFRTMVADAPSLRETIHHLNRHACGPLFKVPDDPRVTPLGRVLRRYSLDELPQLMHVLVGRMSLVGPRPPLPEEVELYTDDVRRKLLVKPGLTGLWQISGRSDLDWDESVRLDLRYVENWSFTLDLMILKKTLSAVARGTGAY